MNERFVKSRLCEEQRDKSCEKDCATKQSQTNPQNFVTIGKILKPRGLAGELKVQILTNKHGAFSFVEKVEKVKFAGAFAYIKFKDVNSIADAEKLRGREIRIPRALMPLGADEVLADDLIGFAVVGQGGEKLGFVRSVETIGKGEVIECVKSPSREGVAPIGDGVWSYFSFPYEDAFVVETNMQERKIVIREKMLAEEEIFG